LAYAAACYAVPETLFLYRVAGDHYIVAWPWDAWFKPKDRLRDLARAGALIAAEMDRIIAEKEDTHDT